MNLYLLRHGIASDLGAGGNCEDAARELTEEGKHRLREIADGMERFGLEFDLIVSSPYARARQTAELIRKTYKKVPLQFCEALIPGGSSKQVVEFLHKLDPATENILLVGHEPSLSEFLSLLISGETSAAIQMKKGGLCKIQIERLRHGRCGMLDWLLTPRQLRALA
jgi:phosphohistidine phosphatase